MTESETASGRCQEKQSDMLSVAEAAVMLGVTERTVARLIVRKTLTSRKVKGRRLIVSQSLRNYLNQKSSKAGTLLSIENRLANLERLLLGAIELYQPNALQDLGRKRELLIREHKPSD
ncbi:helix-turn-helix domain-containing protein [Idiomarina tyrosinivorans]|nr:helix-turn-helix domain-containing protein [Idiomarina tyrosinivorans]